MIGVSVIAGAIAGGAAGVMASSPAFTADVIKCHKIIVGDKATIEIAPGFAGGAHIVMRDPSGDAKMQMGINADGIPIIDLTNKQDSITLIATQGSTGLRVSKNAKPIATLGESIGQPSLNLYDGQGSLRTMLDLGVVPGSNGLSIFGKNKKLLASLGDQSGIPCLILFGDDGKILASLRSAKDSNNLTLCDREEHSRAVLGTTFLESTKTGSTTTTAESALTLFDKEGKVLGKLPSE
jgi:hypothetical protein